MNSTLLSFAQTPAVANQVGQDRSIDPLVKQMEIFVKNGMRETGVPGVAVAVVYQDKVGCLEGFGVRKSGDNAAVDSDTVFQLASLSKPITSTIIASLVGKHEIDWDSKSLSSIRLSSCPIRP